MRICNKFLAFSLLFLASVTVLFPGTDKITGVTAKDEYFLIYGTALSMMERDEWIVPHLDGLPRVQKPPLITWLTRASFELLGASITSGRAVSLLFSGLFILAVALVGFNFNHARSFDYGVAAATIGLSSVGFAVQSRFLMLDIPAAAFSGIAFYCFLTWCQRHTSPSLIAAAVLLACGFMTKEPASLVLFGAGVAALALTNPATRVLLWREKKALCLALYFS